MAWDGEYGDRVRRDLEPQRRLDRGCAAKHELADLLLARRKAVGFEPQRGNQCWMRSLTEDGDRARVAVAEEAPWSTGHDLPAAIAVRVALTKA